MNHPVRTGQIWADTHVGNEGRTIRVERTDAWYAYCTQVTPADNPDTAIGFGLKISHNGHKGLRGYKIVTDSGARGRETA